MSLLESQKEERWNGAEAIFEEIMAVKFLN